MAKAILLSFLFTLSACANAQSGVNSCTKMWHAADQQVKDMPIAFMGVCCNEVLGGSSVNDRHNTTDCKHLLMMKRELERENAD